MGSILSRSTVKEDPAVVAAKRRQEQIRKNGVLIPPVFAVPLKFVPLAPSVYDRLDRTVGLCNDSNTTSAATTTTTASRGHALWSGTAAGPSCLEYLHQSDPSVRLIKDFMTPGLWIYDARTHVRASVITTSDPDAANNSSNSSSNTNKNSKVSNNNKNPTPPVHGRIQVEHSFGGGTGTDGSSSSNNHSSTVRVSGGTESFPSLRFRQTLGQMASLITEVNVNGDAWMGLNFFQSLPLKQAPEEAATTANSSEMAFQLGSWITSKWQPLPTNTTASTAAKPSSTTTTTTTTTPLSAAAITPVKKIKPVINSVHGYAIVDFLGATAAGEISVSPTGPTTSTRTYLSINLTDYDNDNDNADNNPLHLTLEQSDTMAAISLQQTLTFDRIQVNPLDDRAPAIRNQLAWTLRMERALQQQQSGDAQAAAGGTDPNHATNLMAAAIWQINRSVAIKTIIEPNQRTITSALLLKRWKLPRITCSLSHRYQWNHDSSSSKFLGIGFELESSVDDHHQQQQGNNNNNNNNNNAESYYYPRGGSKNQSAESIPETRASLRGEI